MPGQGLGIGPDRDAAETTSISLLGHDANGDIPNDR
jgi:hypothetical protein